jgi:hypothetical protein
MSPARIILSTCNLREEANLILFANTFSIILSDPSMTPDPVPELSLDIVTSEVSPYWSNRVMNFITPGKFLISQDLL